MGSCVRSSRIGWLWRWLLLGCIAACTFLVEPRRSSSQEGADDELVPMVLGLLNEKDEGMRALAFEQIRTAIPGSKATLQFAAQLEKLEPTVQVGLIRALADRGDGGARTGVLAILDASPDVPVKLAALEALGKLGSPEDVSLLIERIAAGTDAEKEVARGSLTQLPGEEVAQLIAPSVSRGETATRLTLMEILTARRGLAAIPELLTAAVDSDPVIRQGGMAALGELASAEHVPAMLLGVLRASKGSERAAAEKSVMFVCGRIESTKERAAPILKFMGTRPAAEQTMLLSTLGRVGGAQALARVEQAISSKEGEVHAAGIGALANWPDASVAERLRQLATKDTHESHRTTMLRAFIRIASLSDQRTDEERLELLKSGMNMATRPEEKQLVIERARAIRHIDTLRYLLGFLDDPKLGPLACKSIVELAHHRALRQAHEKEFHAALDRVIATSKDPIVVERSQRYKANQTWVGPRG